MNPQDDTHAGGDVPVVLLPGHLCSARMWSAQQARLRALGHEVHVLELPGLDSVPALAEDVLAQAPERFALAGFSLGGYVALDVLRQAPQRVERLALLDTAAGPDPADKRPQREENVAMARAGKLEEVVERFARAAVGGKAPTDKAGLYQRVHAMMRAYGAEHFIAQHTAIMRRGDSRGTLSGSRCAVAIIYGEEDALTPPATHRDMANLAPHAVCVGLPGAGHMTPMEQPDVVNALLEAWLQLPARA